MMTAQYQAALHSYAEGRYEEAMQQFSELLYEDPRNPKLHIWLGATFRKAGKIEYAKVQYQQVLTLTDDPDLLDLASTSLAQIQNKLANIAKKNKSPEELKELQENANTFSNFNQKANNQKAKPKGSGDQGTGDQVTDKLEGAKQKNRNSQPKSGRNKSPKSNGTSANSIAYIIDPEDESGLDELTVLATPPNKTIAKPKFTTNAVGASNGNGMIPPPPAIAALSKNAPQNREQVNPLAKPDPKPDHLLIDDQPLIFGDIENLVEDIDDLTDHSSSYALIGDGLIGDGLIGDGLIGDGLIGETQKSYQSINSQDTALKSEKNKDLDSVFLDWGTSSQNSRVKGKDTSAIALEDMFKFSSVGQKITLWGTLIATIPAIALGVVAYQVGDSLLLNRVKQAQQSEAIALANATKSFLKGQTGDVEVLQKLLGSTDLGQTNSSKPANLTNNKLLSIESLPIAEQRQYKQQLTNRLNLYGQAYPEYTSIALFSVNGELLAQSANSKTLQTINPKALNRAKSAETVQLSNSIVTKNGAYFYAVAPIKFAGSPKASVILQVEISTKNLVNELTNARNNNGVGNGNFYVIDSANKYFASSQPITGSEDALADFAILTDLRSGQSANPKDLVRGDRNVQMVAYAPVPNAQAGDSLALDILTTVDKATVIAGNQNLLLVIGIGLGVTPLLAAAIIYALSRRISTRLKDIRAVLRDLRQGNVDASFGALSVEGNDELSDISFSINRMSEQFQTMIQKQEQEKQHLQLQVVKLFKVLAKLAREEKQEVKDEDLLDEKILYLGKKVRAEIVQRHAEAESYRLQKEELQEQLVKMLKDVQALSEGDLTVSTKSIDGSLENVAIFFDDVIRGLHNIVAQVKSSTNQVNFSLGQNEQAIANLASISQRQLDTVTRSLTTAQMAKLSADTIANYSQQVVQSSQLVVEKLSDGDRSLDAVMSKVGELQNTVSTTAKRIKQLGTVSQKIAKAISTINEIAIKTNFLAINATLESSRTGDGVSGFAMVAEEVGELAFRSVEVTKEVEVLLGNIQTETTAVMAAVESGSTQISESNTLTIAAKDSLQQIAQISQQIDGLMAAIAEATSSQVQTSEGVANLMQDISHMAKRTLASSSEAAKFIKATRRYSGDLQQSLTHFKT
ncbi:MULTISPECIES: methyl-accepting chemotaxis protein [Pseudanabaena]|uniref:Methyl-accepting chemotaxis sensory transducer n=2 Tax=Pseudanabaena TaxID=1152 RepID=L8MUH5_9CYAN|nr:MULTISPECIES: methyl-accepting chemotaxis protein [Pseudanabaena]ELS31111.1 methyl-accepting chemotaxis sensory transducer [Pseudanabaena biceps PCC 7429]MDG3496621.1 methyl-accepting chemotaxis protein [Pseudanabaena catenata USMAC16]